jgi:hypothetical protein
MANPLSAKCPVCGALPNKQCIRLNGTRMPGPHARRVVVVSGVKGLTASVSRTLGAVDRVKME